jgi:hypothetical protein
MGGGGGMEGSGGGYGYGYGAANPIMPQQSNVTTNQVTIPNELAGVIIGPRGSKITQLREQSGAGIIVDKPVPGTNDRIITITGTQDQIQNAQYLLQMTYVFISSMQSSLVHANMLLNLLPFQVSNNLACGTATNKLIRPCSLWN